MNQQCICWCPGTIRCQVICRHNDDQDCILLLYMELNPLSASNRIKIYSNILNFAICNYIGKTLKPSGISGNCNIKTSPHFWYIALFKRPSSFWNPCVEGPFWVCCGKLRSFLSDWVIMSTHLRLGRETGWVSLVNNLFVLLKQFPFLYQSLEMDSCKICDVIFVMLWMYFIFIFHLDGILPKGPYPPW